MSSYSHVERKRERARERAAVFHFMVVIVDNGLQLIYSSTINENQVIEMVQFPSPFLTPLTLVLSCFSSSFTKKHCGSLNLFAIKFKTETSQIDSSMYSLPPEMQCVIRVCVYNVHILIKRDKMRSEQQK